MNRNCLLVSFYNQMHAIRHAFHRGKFIHADHFSTDSLICFGIIHFTVLCSNSPAPASLPLPSSLRKGLGGKKYHEHQNYCYTDHYLFHTVLLFWFYSLLNFI